MSEAELDGLERDVAEARQRFAYDLNRLRSPNTIQQFKDELVGDLKSRKDALVERSVESGKQTVRNLVEDVKQRAIANPAAALSIGAGIAWHLLRRPPITSLLVGFGLVSLFRTPPAAANEDVRDNMWRQASTAARYAGELGQDASARLSDAVQTGLDYARDAATSATAAIGDATERAGLSPSALAQRMPLDALGDGRDQALFGAAALCVTAAVAIAVSRREDEYVD